MKRGPHDWIADADVRDPLGAPLRSASRHAFRAHPVGGAWPARLIAGVLARLPGRRARELAAGLRDVITAIRAAGDWQRARVEVLEAQLASLVTAVTPRPWLHAGERPFLLVGTGGGGTRVLAETALRLGVHLGQRLNESFDSVEWAPLVYSLVLDGGDGTERIREHAAAIHAPWAIGDRPWGLKLPELTLCLPQFFAAFPAARVVFLARHPVAASLRRPHITSTPGHPLGDLVLGEARGRPQHLLNAHAWRVQVERVTRALADLPRPRVLRLRLEDFGRDPVGTTATLAAFLERPMDSKAVVRVDDERLHVRDDRRAAEVMAVCGDLAGELGY